MQPKRAGSGRQQVTPPLAPGERLLRGERERGAAGHEVGKAARDRIRQAESDISRGLKDTDLHGIPSDVPGPTPDPQRSPGARPVGTGGAPAAVKRGR